MARAITSVWIDHGDILDATPTIHQNRGPREASIAISDHRGNLVAMIGGDETSLANLEQVVRQARIALRERVDQEHARTANALGHAGGAPGGSRG